MKRLFEIMEKSDTKIARFVDNFIIALIVFNIFVVILQSYKQVYDAYSTVFEIVETVSVALFSIEYILRVIVSPYRYSEKYEFKNLLRYIVSGMAIVDLLAILPYYLPFLIGYDLRVLRIIKLFRLLRVLKLTRYTKAFDVLVSVLKKRKEELILSTFILLILVFFVGTLMYFTENEVQPNVFPNIIDSVKWSITTMVFLGYSDTVPLTPVGGFLGMLTVLLGLGWLSLPISILSSGFIEEIANRKEKIEKEG